MYANAHGCNPDDGYEDQDKYHDADVDYTGETENPINEMQNSGDVNLMGNTKDKKKKNRGKGKY